MIKIEGVTHAMFEALTIAAEECDEVGQCVSKIFRFGMVASPFTGKHNRARLEEELGHVLAAIALLDANGAASFARITEHAEAKLADYARPDGPLKHARLPSDVPVVPEAFDTEVPTNPDVQPPAVPVFVDMLDDWDRIGPLPDGHVWR